MAEKRVAEAMQAAGIPVTTSVGNGWAHTPYYMAAKYDSGQYVSLKRAKELWHADGCPSQYVMNVDGDALLRDALA